MKQRRLGCTVLLSAFLLITTFGTVFWWSWKGEKVSALHNHLYNLQYRHIPYYRGRKEGAKRVEATSTSVGCCQDSDCLQADRGRYAVVVPLRSKNYIGLVKELQCTLQRSNPGVPLVFLTVRGDLQPAELDQLYILGKVEFVEDLYFPNAVRTRFGLNWVKLQAWRLVQYDAILLLDADTIVLADITHPFHLPTHYAATMEMHKWEYRHDSLGTTQGGVMMLRPCNATANHMVELLRQDVMLRYERDRAEQTFLDWYFKFERMVLPIQYNYVSYRLTSSGEMWHGGVPKILHLTRNKPMNGPTEGSPGHQYLCSNKEHQQVNGR